MNPKELVPILAEIWTITELGESRWYEVVYFSDGEWQHFAGSDTFDNGESVARWIYAKDCFDLIPTAQGDAK